MIVENQIQIVASSNPAAMGIQFQRHHASCAQTYTVTRWEHFQVWPAACSELS